MRKVYCEIVIAKWSRHVTKLAINRQEITCVSLRMYFCTYSLFLHLLTYYITKLRRPKIYLRKEEKSLPAEIEIVFLPYVALWKDEISDEIKRKSLGQVFVFSGFFLEKSKGF